MRLRAAASRGTAAASGRTPRPGRRARPRPGLDGDDVADDHDAHQLRGDQRHPAFGLVHAEGSADRAEDDPHEAVPDQLPPLRVEHGADQGQQRQPDRLVVPDREEGPQQPLARAVDPALGDRQQHLARVERGLQRRQEQVVLAPEVVVHQRRVHPGGGGDRADRRAGVPLGGEQRPRLGQDRRPGVGRAGPSAAAGGGSHDHTVRRGAYLPGSTSAAARRRRASPGTTTRGPSRRRVEA